MELVTGARASGKTTKLVELANQHSAYIAVRNKKTATELHHEVERFPITHEELLTYQSHVPVVVDDIDHFLSRMATIKAVSITPTKIHETSRR